MRKLSHNYFPLTLGKGKPLYIRSIYTFSFPREKVDIFPLREILKSNFPSDIFPLISYRLDPHQSKIRRVLSICFLQFSL